MSSCHVDLEKELKVVTEAAPPGEELRAGDKHGLLLLMNLGRIVESPEYISRQRETSTPMCLVLFHVNGKVSLQEHNLILRF